MILIAAAKETRFGEFLPFHSAHRKVNIQRQNAKEEIEPQEYFYVKFSVQNFLLSMRSITSKIP